MIYQKTIQALAAIHYAIPGTEVHEKGLAELEEAGLAHWDGSEWKLTEEGTRALAATLPPNVPSPEEQALDRVQHAVVSYVPDFVMMPAMRDLDLIRAALRKARAAAMQEARA